MTRDARLWTRAGVWLAAIVATAVSGTGTGPVSGTGPGPVPGPSHVEAIYPTADQLPANTLRFYIVFSAPMSAGEAHERLRLVNDRGQVVPGAFLELEEELWDPTGRRLTVLLDPGRIKRGLRANLESGAPLIEGRSYRLEVDPGWRDARGVPMSGGHVKAFRAGPDDRTSPDVEAWTLQAPAAGTRQPLIVRFAEPLDRALLASAVQVVTEAGVVEGEIDVRESEREWRFTPHDVWTSGRYGLRVEAELEDVAGNNLHRVFDVDVSRGSAPSGASAFRVRPFDIRPGT